MFRVSINSGEDQPDDPRCAMRELEQRGRSLRNEFEP